ncbi:MAG: DoxX family protein [Flavobacterium lindanitolerans]|uniref:DoxX family protein n=1 Tax=Flavobacterium lindanitolerans TaxID=428988 RepID=UPI001A5B8EA0|nr:DoxX family protein [Flavobacterium lindanitolerans]MBL7868903.1 DoxX family protein [Flavobacterium lindanitolerans]
MDRTFILRFAVAFILIMHSVPGMFNNGIHEFGIFYLNTVGFAPYGVLLAWLIKLSHVVAAVLLLLNKYVKIASIVTIFVLIMGIIMVHYPEGWFVVGGGRNGVEFNFLLIFVLLAIMFPEGINSKLSKK